MVIWPEVPIGQYRDDGHWGDAPQFMLHTVCNNLIRLARNNRIIIKFGSMIITMDVAFPKTDFSPEQKKIIMELLQQDDVKPDFYNGLKFPKKNK